MGPIVSSGKAPAASAKTPEPSRTTESISIKGNVVTLYSPHGFEDADGIADCAAIAFVHSYPGEYDYGTIKQWILGATDAASAEDQYVTVTIVPELRLDTAPPAPRAPKPPVTAVSPSPPQKHQNLSWQRQLPAAREIFGGDCCPEGVKAFQIYLHEIHNCALPKTFAVGHAPDGLWGRECEQALQEILTAYGTTLDEVKEKAATQGMSVAQYIMSCALDAPASGSAEEAAPRDAAAPVLLGKDEGQELAAARGEAYALAREIDRVELQLEQAAKKPRGKKILPKLIEQLSELRARYAEQTRVLESLQVHDDDREVMV